MLYFVVLGWFVKVLTRGREELRYCKLLIANEELRITLRKLGSGKVPADPAMDEYAVSYSGLILI